MSALKKLFWVGLKKKDYAYVLFKIVTKQYYG